MRVLLIMNYDKMYRISTKDKFITTLKATFRYIFLIAIHFVCGRRECQRILCILLIFPIVSFYLTSYIFVGYLRLYAFY